jgi:hypothetical protein
LTATEIEILNQDNMIYQEEGSLLRQTIGKIERWEVILLPVKSYAQK